MPRPALRLAAFLCLALVAALQSAQAADSKPNIVFIVADDLGYGDLGIHGGKDIPTPHIDSIAKGGIRFTSGYVSGPYCSPTRAGLLTGRYQQRFGHEFNPSGQLRPGKELGLSLEETTLPSRLKSAGYATGMVGKWHLGNAPKFHPQQRGFEEFFGFLGGAHSYVPGGNPNDPIRRGTEPVEEPEYLTEAFGREAVAYIEHQKDHPFFLYLTFNAVHTPMQAPEKQLARFNSISDERRRTYAGMLSSLDDAVGLVLGKLDELKLTENTLIVFISDNGGPPVNGSTNTPLNGQKATTWEGGVRVPFFVQWKGKLPAGQTYEQPVIQLDLLPTALAAAGVKEESKLPLDGVNLLPYLQGEAKAAPHDALYWRFGAQSAVREGDWKLLKVQGDTKPRLYNLAADIGESKDLAASEPERVQHLQQLWNAWNEQLVEPSWTPGPQQGNGKAKGKNKKKSS